MLFSFYFGTFYASCFVSMFGRFFVRYWIILGGFWEPKSVIFGVNFGLIFACIDLIYADESFYFFEANPSPGYDYFEKAVGSEVISAALYAVLTRQVARC